MPITKKEIIKAINNIPKEEFTSVDEVIEIILLEKIEAGLKAMENKDVVSEEDANKRMDSWRRNQECN